MKPFRTREPNAAGPGDRDRRGPPARRAARLGRPVAQAPPAAGGLAGLLSSCETEADIVQVLYAELHPAYGYDIINLHVLEREGWYHSLAVDRGVLQDVRRRRLAESSLADHYREPRARVVEPAAGTAYERGRGPGASRRPRTLIWVPVLHRGRAIGSITYQLYERRAVPAEEMARLEEVHAQLGVLVSDAWLNELSRNQAVSLSALNAIARALSATHDQEGVVAALASALGGLLPVDLVELVVPDTQAPDRLRVVRAAPGGRAAGSWVSARSRRLGAARRVLAGAGPELGWRGAAVAQSEAWVPVLEGGEVRGALCMRHRHPGAYEQSTLTFLQQVADQVALALRSARSYSRIEAQSRRLEVVNAVGRRLASTLDRWSIMRTLREELTRYLEFDLFCLATVAETEEGPVAEGYVYDSGEEHPLRPVPLAVAGASRDAYENGRSVVIGRSPWARSLESGRRTEGERVIGEGVVLDVTRPGRHRRVAARSMVWVPVRQDDRVTALLTLQSYRAEVFGDWHVQLLEDVAAQVGLALANAGHFHAAQAERHRLEALHHLEMGVAGAADEAQVAEAVVSALRGHLRDAILMLAYLDARGRVTGHCAEPGAPVVPMSPVPLESTVFFRRLMAGSAPIVDVVPADRRQPRPHPGWPTWAPRVPAQVVWIPFFHEGSVAGGISAQRMGEAPFTEVEVELLQSAAPVIGMALRSVRLHRANELALAHSVRIQEVARLAGHDLARVVASVAELARPTLEARGAACWAFDEEGRVSAQASVGGGGAARVLGWSGRTAARPWSEAPAWPLSGRLRNGSWTLVPLWHADRLVGALGSVHAPGVAGESLAAAGDFARHAAIAIENARLAAETLGRIRTLEAVAELGGLDITRPARALAEMCRLIERALAGSHGAVWLLEGQAMVRAPAGDPASATLPPQPEGWAALLRPGRGGRAGRRLQRLLRAQAAAAAAGRPGAAGPGQEEAPSVLFALPISAGGRVAGMLTADAAGASPGEVRRVAGVLAGQAALVLGRLALVAELERQAGMLETVFRHSPVGLVLEDAAGDVVYANPEIERIYGAAAGELTGTPARDLPGRSGAVVVLGPEAEPGPAAEPRPPGAATVVQVRRVPIPRSGDQPDRALTLHEDVTRERALAEAQELMLRAIGHEVRSPAAAMRSTIAGLMQWGTLIDPDHRDMLVAEAYEQSDRLLSLVESQLLITKLETPQFEATRAPVPLDRALEQVTTVLRSRYGERADAVGSRLRPGLPPALCDAAHLEQVLTNLVGNALEYASARRVRVGAEASAGWIEVTVADEGPGLPAERVPDLFEKAGPAGRNRSHGGLGLGLYLCRLIVQRSFGGRIWLDGTGPQGTVFKFTVPAAPPRAPAGAGRGPAGGRR